MLYQLSYSPRWVSLDLTIPQEKIMKKKYIDLMSWELESSTLSQTAAVNCCEKFHVTKSHQQIQ
jgi:hypothetical protein